jgi:hypothetical protein
VAWVAGVLGFLALAGGSYLAFARMQALSPADASVAFANLAYVKLDQIATAKSPAIPVVIPDTPQWVRIRRKWGEPDFLIAAISAGKSSCYCLPKLPVTINLVRDGDQIPIEPTGPPYGHSSACELSSFGFNAAPGTKLTVSVVKNGTESLPPGDLIIVGSWWNTKDKLVGLALDQWLGNAPTIAIVGGVGLILAPWLIWRRRA